jgi:hypothetical protein
MYIHCCHCLDCQRQTGSAFAINALIESDNVGLLAGVPAPFPVPTESGRPHDIWRCADCGTALWSDYGRRGWLYFVRVATLDEPHALRPDIHIFTRSKVPWVDLPENAKRVDVYYDRDAEWSPESIDRIKVAAAKAGN